MLKPKESQSCQTVKNEKQTRREELRNIMNEAWQLVRRNGLNLKDALRKSWQLFKLKMQMKLGIVEFRFTKISGEIRQAFGSLSDKIVPPILGTDTRKKCDTLFTYWDCEKSEWRSFKRVNLLSINF